MRGLILCLIAVGLMAGCQGSKSLHGRADSTSDPVFDTEAEPDVMVEPDTPADSAGEEPSVEPECGNGIVEDGEECDDGDEDPCNGCNATCMWGRALGAVPTRRSASALWPAPCISCPFTYEAWFRLDVDNGCLVVVDQSDFLVFWVRSNQYTLVSPFDERRFHAWGSVGLGDLAPGQWRHFAYECRIEESGTYQFNLYLGGVHVNETSSVAPTFPCVDRMTMGGPLPGTLDPPFCQGKIDDLRISLEPLYEGRDFVPSRFLEPVDSTIVFLDFDTMEDGMIPDVSGNGYDAFMDEGSLVRDDCHVP